MFMGPSGDHRAHAISRHLKVLLPPPFSSLHKLRISDDLARELDSDTGADGTALVVSPFGSKVWRVEVGRDGSGAFLGRGWPEFVAAHGIGALWFLVFRHKGGGTLTVKAFDTSFCLHEFSHPINVAANQSTTSGRSGRPQFVTVLLRGIRKKMLIPSRFVRNHLTEAETSSRLTVLLRMCRKDWRVNVEKDSPGNVFLSGGWSRFLAFNGINEGEVLLLRYEGNLLFTVKAFGLDGNQKSDQMKIKKGEDAHSSSTAVKRKSKNEGPSIAERKRPTDSATPSSKGSEGARTQSNYDIGPPSWIKKEISAYALQHHLSLSSTFCKTIGFLETCEITLRTSTGNGATRSWQVNVGVHRCSSQYWLGKGWKSFCGDNGLKEGDICTFNIIKTTLWHVDIVRRP